MRKGVRVAHPWTEEGGMIHLVVDEVDEVAEPRVTCHHMGLARLAKPVLCACITRLPRVSHAACAGYPRTC
eukprot:54357-Eustigmatos_ZCMA.PRE.1